jgi:hypothetical protein
MRRNCPRRCRLPIWQPFRRPRPRSLHKPSRLFHHRFPSFRSFRFPVEVAVCHLFLRLVVEAGVVVAGVVAAAVVEAAVVETVVVAVAEP